ncbi:MAG: glycosyltransferase [Bacteroidia bacterium]
MNVLFISGWYPTPQNKTHGIFVKRYAEAISLEHKVAVIHPYGSGDFPDEVKIESHTDNNVFEVYVYFKKKKLNPLSKLKNYKNHYLLGLDHLLKTWGKPDLLQINVFFPASIAGLEIAKKLNIPFVVSEHWTGYDLKDGSYNGIIKKYFTIKAAKKAARIITVSADLKNKMLAHGLKGNYSVIPNVVDTSVFHEVKSELTGRFKFLHVSSLDPLQKNVEGLIETFAKLNKENPLTELFIVGDGPNRSRLEARAGTLLNRSIFFMGQKMGNDLSDEFRNANCFVMFSNYENLPVVILEALCCGVPVISSNAGGIGERVNEQNGTLVKAGDKFELLKAMKEMAEGNKKYDRKKISEEACANFNYRKIATMFTSVYEEVLRSKK